MNGQNDGYADDKIGKLRLEVRGDEVCGCEEGQPPVYLGEFGLDDFVVFIPSNRLLLSTPGFQSWITCQTPDRQLCLA